MGPTERYRRGVDLDKFRARLAPLLDSGEHVVAAVKATPRGAAQEAIARGAGAAGGASVSASLAGPGAVAGEQFGTRHGEAGRQERRDAGLDVGNATQVVLVVTAHRVLLVERTAFGRPKAILAATDRSLVASVEQRESTLFGQSMPEIVLTMASGVEAGFSIARVDRADAQVVLAALGS